MEADFIILMKTIKSVSGNFVTFYLCETLAVTTHVHVSREVIMLVTLETLERISRLMRWWMYDVKDKENSVARW